MSGYHCKNCGMHIKPLQCGKCDTTLEHKTIRKDNALIQVCVCPDGCGKVKSPQCCGKDMKHVK